MRRRTVSFRPTLESPEVRLAPSSVTVAIVAPADPAMISATLTAIGNNPPPTSGPVGPGTS